MDINLLAIGSRIKKRRKDLHLTQSEIKQAVGISSGNLSDIENGNRAPAIGTLYKLSIILQCSIDWIVTGENTSHSLVGISDEGELELLDGFRQLSKDNQDELLAILKIKLQRTISVTEDKSKLSLFEDTSPANIS